MSDISLTIDGQQVVVPSGSSILDAAQKLEIFIPTFCHEPELPGVASCRICVVEDDRGRLAPSCMTAAKEGMKIKTDSEPVIEARKTILELMLANHPQDCLTCDKNGNCKLQDYAFLYNVKGPTFTGEKHEYTIENDNPYIIRDMNKCILCGKCVRSCAQAERSVIDYAYRGFDTKIAPAMDVSLGESDCVFCGRCVAVCPVGALTWKPLAGKGRTWEFDKQEVSCRFCESGCAFDLLKKEGEVIGVIPKNPAPGKPLCLKGYLGLELLYNKKPPQPQLRKNGEFKEVSWVDALGLNDVLEKIKEQEGSK